MNTHQKQIDARTTPNKNDRCSVIKCKNNADVKVYYEEEYRGTGPHPLIICNYHYGREDETGRKYFQVGIEKIEFLTEKNSQFCSVDKCNNCATVKKIEEFFGDRSGNILFSMTHFFCKEHIHMDYERVNGSQCAVKELEENEND